MTKTEANKELSLITTWDDYGRSAEESDIELLIDKIYDVEQLANDELQPLLDRIRKARGDKEETLTLCVSDLALMADHIEDLEK